MNETALDIEWEKGQIVKTPLAAETNSYYLKTIPGEQYVITRVYKNKVELRGNFQYRNDTPREQVNTVNKVDIAPADGPEPRRLGQVPEGDFISPEDPRIAWLWEDAALAAKMNGLCRDYDRLTADLGIPGRERDFTVSTTINGLNIQTKVRAHSRVEAERIVAGKLGTEQVHGQDAEDF